MSIHRLARMLVALVAGVALVSPLAGTASAKPSSLPDRLELPNGFRPEGITIGPGPFAYFGSRLDGAIYAADLRTGRGGVISPGAPGRVAIGLKSDQRDLLYVAGGATGTGRIVSSRTGQTLATYRFTSGTSFVNDVVLSRGMAWFTDSQQAQLYGVPLARHGRPAPASAVVRRALSGNWQQAPDVINANGIAPTPDRRALLVVQSNTGLLFRVNPRTGVARPVNLGGTLLPNGDGLLLRGRTLYVVQNALNTVAVVRVSQDGSQGRLVRKLTSPDFDVPTTVAAFRHGLYLPNARFGTPETPQTAYWVTRIERR